VTHDIAEALRLGTHIALLDEGRLEAIAPTAGFRSLDNPKVQAFLGCLET
jgi:ABC-type proline/glycine betaine transport system ATPase subunit